MTRPERAVVEDRVEQHQRQTDQSGAETGDQGAVAEGRRHRLRVERIQSHGQGAELHGDRQVLRALFGERSRDLTGAVETREGGLRRLDERRRLDDAVEFDGERLVEVLVGDVVPLGAALFGQGVVHDPRADLVLLGDGLADGLTGQLRRSEKVASARASRGAAR